MKKNGKWNVGCIVMIACGLAAFLLPMLLGGCTGMIEKADGGTVPMKCVWTMRADTLVGLLIALLAVAQLFLKNLDAKLFSAVAIAALAIVSLLMMQSVGIGLCMKPEMICHTNAVYVRIADVCALVMAAVQFFLARSADKPSKRF